MVMAEDDVIWAAPDGGPGNAELALVALGLQRLPVAAAGVYHLPHQVHVSQLLPHQRHLNIGRPVLEHP